MNQHNSSKILRLVTVTPTRSEQDTFVTNIDGTRMSVFNAPIIRALSQGLGIPFEIVMPEDDTFGYKKPDGNWSGVIGMLVRGEADLTVSGLTENKERREVVNFTFPLYVSDVSFITNKPEPYPKKFAVFEVFSAEVWISLAMCIALISLILYILFHGKQNYSTIILDTVRSVLEKSHSFDAKQKNTVCLLLTWFLGIMILTTSYKAVLLSVITIPRTVGIRDIEDLSKAAKEGSVKCMSYEGGIPSVRWFELNDERFISIGENMKQSEMEGLHGQGSFLSYSGKKAFIADRLDLITYERNYFVSRDSFSLALLGIAYSKNFCCPRELESVVHRIVVADLYAKTLRDREFMAQMRMSLRTKDVYHEASTASLTLEDFNGAFLVLLMGYLFSSLVFIIEMSVKSNCLKSSTENIIMEI